MKKILTTLLAVTVIAGIYGCGDNKTREKLMGTSVVNSNTVTGSGGSFLSNPDATSMTALYKASFMGGGAGSFAMSAPQRLDAPSMRAPSGNEGVGLGTPNSNGEYIITDPMGMTVTLKFKKGSDTVYMDFSKTFTSSGLSVYSTQAFTGNTKYTLGSDHSSITTLTTALGLGTFYIPSVWIKASDGLPISWYSLTMAKLTGGLSDLESWMFANFPDSMVNTVSGSIPGGTLSMTMTSAMPSSRPTNANPATMTGNGTITFATGEVWTLTTSMLAGENGPISGTMSYSSSSGETGTMTFNADGSMDGVQRQGTTTIATIHIGTDGTGTYTDVATGQTYSISGARPS